MVETAKQLLTDCLKLCLSVLRECEDDKPELADEANDLFHRIEDYLEPPDEN